MRFEQHNSFLASLFVLTHLENPGWKDVTKEYLPLWLKTKHT